MPPSWFAAQVQSRSGPAGLPSYPRRLVGQGAAAEVDGEPVVCGRAGGLRQSGVADDALAADDREATAGLSAIFVAKGGKYLGWIGLQDRVRPGAREALAQLAELGIKRVAMVTGDVRETAVWALGQLEDATVADGLGQVLASDRDADVRGTAAWALGQLELSSAPRGLLAALTDGDPAVRLRAAWALSEIADAAALPALRAALGKEQDAKVRRAQVRALIKAGERTEELTRLLESPDPEIRQAAVRGLAGRRGVDPWPWPEPRPRPFPR